MSEYGRMSREELVERLKALEKERLQTQQTSVLERAQAADALYEGEERLRAILRTAVEGIITIDDRGRIESMNPAAERIFGYPSTEVIGRNVSMLMPSPYHENHDRYLENYQRTGQAKIIGIGREVVGRRKDGSLFPMDLAVSEVKLTARTIFTGFVRDVTEQKRLQKEILQISESERHRIGQDLHDGICQHLAAIEMMSQVLSQTLEARSKPQAAQAAQIAREMREVIAQTRALARGLSPLLLESDGLAAALQELALSSEKLFKVNCRHHCPEPVVFPDKTAATHLYRIAQEAVTNAVKHGKAERIDIYLTRKQGRLSLSVSDNGRGFPAGNNPAKGMGLRVMQYRTNIIGGALEIERRPNGVTVTCSVALPAENASLTAKCPFA